MKLFDTFSPGENFEANVLRITFNAYLGHDGIWSIWHTTSPLVKRPTTVSNKIVRIITSHRGNDIDLAITDHHPDFKYLAIEFHETGQVLLFRAKKNHYWFLQSTN